MNIYCFCNKKKNKGKFERTNNLPPSIFTATAEEQRHAEGLREPGSQEPVIKAPWESEAEVGPRESSSSPHSEPASEKIYSLDDKQKPPGMFPSHRERPAVASFCVTHSLLLST